MNSRNPFYVRTALFLSISVLASARVLSEPLTLLPESTLSLSGDSTLHPFISTATMLIASAEADVLPGTEWIKAVLEKGALKKWELVIPVKGLKSKESSLDKNMYKALKAEEFPEIVFKMAGYEVMASTLSAGGFRVKATGMLSIAGKEQPVQLDMEALPEAAVLQVKGRHTLLMTDYGIKPPSLMMGAIKVRNPITIQFDIRVR